MELLIVIASGICAIMVLGVLLNLHFKLTAYDGQKTRYSQSIAELERRNQETLRRIAPERQRRGEAARSLEAAKSKAESLQHRLAAEQATPGTIYYVTADMPNLAADSLWAVDLMPRTSPRNALDRIRWREGRQVLVWAATGQEATERALQAHPGGDGYAVGQAYQLNERILSMVRL